MDEIDVHEAIDHDRRRLFGAAALTFAAAELGVIGAADAETKAARPPMIKAGTNASFAPQEASSSWTLCATRSRRTPA
jgi:hypothetical protein